MNPTYEDEEKIFWLRDQDALSKMDYVRERWQIASIRTGPVRAPAGEVLIGYAVLKKTAAKTDGKGFCRRIFTLRLEELPPGGQFRDLKFASRKSIPPEAVDPLTIEAGKPSRPLLGANKMQR